MFLVDNDMTSSELDAGRRLLSARLGTTIIDATNNGSSIWLATTVQDEACAPPPPLYLITFQYSREGRPTYTICHEAPLSVLA